MASNSIPSKGLYLDWCSHEAAKFAVEHWHYSKVMPKGKLIKIGVWEDGRFIGVVLFGRGANNHIGNPFSLTQTEAAELVRIALIDHTKRVKMDAVSTPHQSADESDPPAPTYGRIGKKAVLSAG